VFTREFLIATRIKLWAAAIAVLTCAGSGYVRADECKQELPGYLVRSVNVKARWLPEFGSSPFRTRDLQNPDSLLAKLKGQTPLSQYLRSKLGPTTVELINQHTRPGQQREILIEALINDLNTLLKGGPLYQEEAFAEVTLGVDTQRMIEQNPKVGEGLFRLNRMLLEDAYPNELAKDSKVYLPLHRNEEFTPDKLSATRFSVIQAINRQKRKYNSEFINLGKLPLVDVNVVTACGRRVPPATCRAEGLTDKCVDVEVHPYAISTDPVFIGSVLLPLPRSNEFSFLDHVPRPLRLLDPRFGLNYDGELGTVPELEVSTDLLSLNKVLVGEPAEARRTSLLLKAKGGRSIGERFYAAQAQLSFSVRQPTEHIESVGIAASFAAGSQPQLRSVDLNNTFRVGAHVALNPELGVLNRVEISAAYRRANHRFSGDTRPNISARENSYEGRAILEGRLFNGFTRMGFWLDGGTPHNQRFYGRISGLIGHEKEVPIGEHTLGIEALLGFGRASDNTPEYALFYGGNTLNSFLYQETNDPTLSSLPSGPLLRSFGKNQAGFVLAQGPVAGANAYQHFNLNVSIPIPKLSSPLIPDEVVIAQPRKTLRSLINFAVNSGQEALSLNLQDEGLSEEEADKKAAKIFAQIRPGVEFLTHYGKVYSLKPMVMFDYTRLTRVGSGGPQIRYAVGGGLQFTMVVAKFEAGYLRTVRALPGDSRGNLVVRLVFQNLF
jgi:hypothetical protein